jgi:TrmH family RNA methyltransferase
MVNNKITSLQNERIKYTRSLARRRVRQREGRFLVEGTRLLEEVLRAGIMPTLVFYTEAWAAGPGGQRLMASLDPTEGIAWPVSNAVLAACAGTQTPQGVIAVVPFVDLEPGPGLVLILDRLGNPGNLGTILRSAEAAGVGHVVLAPATVDAYNPKVVRGAMGAHFRLPLSHLDWPSIAERVAERHVWLADATGEIAYDAVDWTQSSALVVGSESTGASKEACQLAKGKVRIPMAEGPESLNAAMAATVILFEAARQQRSSVSRPPVHNPSQQ